MTDTLSDATGCFGAANQTVATMQTFVGALADTMSFKLDGTDGAAVSMEGDVYVVPDFGAHFDGDTDRVSLTTGADYACVSHSNAQKIHALQHNLIGIHATLLTALLVCHRADAAGDGFAFSFWFTKEVCNAEQVRVFG